MAGVWTGMHEFDAHAALLARAQRLRGLVQQLAAGYKWLDEREPAVVSQRVRLGSPRGLGWLGGPHAGVNLLSVLDQRPQSVADGAQRRSEAHKVSRLAGESQQRQERRERLAHNPVALQAGKSAHPEVGSHQLQENCWARVNLAHAPPVVSVW